MDDGAGLPAELPKLGLTLLFHSFVLSFCCLCFLFYCYYYLYITYYYMYLNLMTSTVNQDVQSNKMAYTITIYLITSIKSRQKHHYTHASITGVLIRHIHVHQLYTVLIVLGPHWHPLCLELLLQPVVHAMHLFVLSASSCG